jgi:hypothetical protein
MPGYYRLQPEDLMPSDEELEMMRTAQSAPGTGEAIGGLIGTGLGAATALIPGVGPAIAPFAMPLGGMAGRMIGGGIGGMVAEGPEERLSEIEQERQEKITAQQMRDDALRRLLETA